MEAIDFLKKLSSLCDERCNSNSPDLANVGCPFPWRYCDLYKPFYDLTDHDIQKIVQSVEKYERRRL